MVNINAQSCIVPGPEAILSKNEIVFTNHQVLELTHIMYSDLLGMERLVIGAITILKCYLWGYQSHGFYLLRFLPDGSSRKTVQLNTILSSFSILLYLGQPKISSANQLSNSNTRDSNRNQIVLVVMC